MNEEGKYNVTGAIYCTLTPYRSTVRYPSFSFCIKSLTVPSYKPCRKFLVYAPEGYAGGGLLGTDWYAQKEKK